MNTGRPAGIQPAMSRVALALALLAASCSDGSSLGPIDAAVIDAVIDTPLDAAVIDAAEVDAPLDAAEVDAPLDAAEVDASIDAPPGVVTIPGGWRVILYGGVVWAHAIAGSPTDFALCMNGDHDIAPQMRAGLVRPTGVALGDQLPATCFGLAPLDDHRVLIAPGNHPGTDAILIEMDLVANTWSSFVLPAPVLARPSSVYRIPGGAVVLGRGDTSMVRWRIDDAHAVVWSTVTSERMAFLGAPVPAAAPTHLAVTDLDYLAMLDLATGAMGPATPVAVTGFLLPAAGSQGLLVLGTAGTSLAIVPVDSTIPTVLDAPADWSGWITTDALGRALVVANSPGLHELRVYRIDPSRFDGVDGASRLDPTFGDSGVLRIQPPTSCEPSPFPCGGSTRIMVGSTGDLILAVSFYVSNATGASPGVTYYGWLPVD